MSCSVHEAVRFCGPAASRPPLRGDGHLQQPPLPAVDCFWASADERMVFAQHGNEVSYGGQRPFCHCLNRSADMGSTDLCGGCRLTGWQAAGAKERLHITLPVPCLFSLPFTACSLCVFTALYCTFLAFRPSKSRAFLSACVSPSRHRISAAGGR